MGTTRILFARAIIQRAGLSRITANEMCLVAVMTGEDSLAWWNALDTTLPHNGATPYNSFGPNGEYHVWNYSTAVTGVNATVATMLQDNMKPWMDALRDNKLTAIQKCEAFGLVPWAGVGDTLPTRIAEAWASKQRKYITDAKSQVGGSGPWPYRVNGKPKLLG